MDYSSLASQTAPFIGIAVPTFNRPDYLQILLRSIPDWVAVVVSDNGGNLSPSFKEDFPTVFFCSTETVLKTLENWNRAVRAQTSAWIAIPGDDDVYREGAFDIIRDRINDNPDADLIIFGHDIVDSRGTKLSSWTPRPGMYKRPGGFSRFKYGIDARMPSIFFRKSIFEKLNGFDQRFLITAGDSDFLQRATLIGNCCFCQEIVSGYRVWPGGATSQLIATPAWMQEIELWCESIRRFDAEQGIGIYSEKVRDEIYLRNIIGGLLTIGGAKKRASRLCYLRQFSLPKKGRLKSYLRLAKALLR